jgi:hypothetical protein
MIETKEKSHTIIVMDDMGDKLSKMTDAQVVAVCLEVIDGGTTYGASEDERIRCHFCLGYLRSKLNHMKVINDRDFVFAQYFMKEAGF